MLWGMLFTRGLGQNGGVVGSVSSPPRSPDPMLATLGPLPVGEGWSFEPKWDGFRARCFVDRDRVSLVSRRGNDLTRLYPGVSVLAGSDTEPAVLDGEIVAFPNGSRASRRSRASCAGAWASTMSRSLPSICYGRGRSLQRTPYTERREELEALPFRRPLSL
jgi:bifunctional non-homologous end joining protein LigD